MFFPFGAEAADHEDLVRLCGCASEQMQMNLSFGFARAVGSVLDTSNYEVLYPADSPHRQAISVQGKRLSEKKTQQFPKQTSTLLASCTRPCVVHVMSGGY